MNITCPDCAFSREVAQEDLPPRTVIANCPKCGCRFRFSPTEGVLEKISEGNPKDEVREEPAPAEDDPLPKGAIIVDPKKKAQRAPDDDNAQDGERGEREERRRLRVSSFRAFSQNIPDGNPWARTHASLPLAFFQTIVRVAVTPQRFFRAIRPESSLTRPLLFFLLVTIVEFFANFAWMALFRSALGDANDPQLSAVLSLVAPQGNILLVLLLQAAMATLKLYVLSAIFFSVYRLITGEQPSFSAIFQVLAYSIAPAVCAVVPLVGSLVGCLWGLGCLAIGLRQVLSLTWLQTAMGFLPLVVLYALFLRFVVLA